MKVHLIGTSDGLPTKDRFCSCNVVTVNGNHYVVDAGVSLYTMMIRNDYNPADIRAVFITHMHGDHANGLAEYVDFAMCDRRNTVKTEFFVPTCLAKYTVQAYAVEMDHLGGDIDMHVYSEGVIYEDENVKVTAYRTEHSEASYGFLIEGEGKRVYFTSDMRWDLTDMPDFVYKEKTNLIVCESAHNCLPDRIDELNTMKTDRIIINHIAAGHSIKDYNEAKPYVTKPFDLAFDGMIVEL